VTVLHTVFAASAYELVPTYTPEAGSIRRVVQRWFASCRVHTRIALTRIPVLYSAVQYRTIIFITWRDDIP